MATFRAQSPAATEPEEEELAAFSWKHAFFSGDRRVCANEAIDGCAPPGFQIKNNKRRSTQYTPEAHRARALTGFSSVRDEEDACCCCNLTADREMDADTQAMWASHHVGAFF